MSSYQIGIFISAAVLFVSRTVAYTAVRRKAPRWVLYICVAVGTLCGIAVAVFAVLLVLAARAGRY